MVPDDGNREIVRATLRKRKHFVIGAIWCATLLGIAIMASYPPSLSKQERQGASTSTSRGRLAPWLGPMTPRFSIRSIILAARP